uniref:Protein Vpu n=1 Tax=Human immunodeficiency virus type 1 TaxID=11676 RepID=G8I1B8_HV1|nr:vpu protein [Human immunodeficiency virus 1]
MLSLQIAAIVALVVVEIIAIVVGTIVLIEYRKLLRQKKIDRLIDRIKKKAKNRGNKSKGKKKKLAALKLGRLAPWNVNNL